MYSLIGFNVISRLIQINSDSRSNTTDIYKKKTCKYNTTKTTIVAKCFK